MHYNKFDTTFSQLTSDPGSTSVGSAKSNAAVTHCPWGLYEVINENKHYKVKRIAINPGARISLQAHQHRHEHWIIVEGIAKVTNNDAVFIAEPNQAVFIPAQTKHRIENITQQNLIFIEVQYGSYIGEDDIHRYDDDYQR